MENIDPVGVHTGDSIVVAPSQTLTDLEYQMLRTASINVIRALNVQGGCNIQFALHPAPREYPIIEVNPRVSRSSALASKATGYPIAKIATRIALGQRARRDSQSRHRRHQSRLRADPRLLRRQDSALAVRQVSARRFRLGTQMKSTGEAMGIGRTFRAALMKAIRGLDLEARNADRRRFAEWSDEELELARRRRRTSGSSPSARSCAAPAPTPRPIDDIHAQSAIDRFWL